MKFDYLFPLPFSPNPSLQSKPHPSCADLGILTVFGPRMLQKCCLLREKVNQEETLQNWPFYREELGQ